MEPDVSSISRALAWPAAASTATRAKAEFAFTIVKALHIGSMNAIKISKSELPHVTGLQVHESCNMFQVRCLPNALEQIQARCSPVAS